MIVIWLEMNLYASIKNVLEKVNFFELLACIDVMFYNIYWNRSYVTDYLRHTGMLRGKEGS